MNVTTKLELGRALRQEARLVLATMSPLELDALIEQLPLEQRRMDHWSKAPHHQIIDQDADHLVELGLAVRTPYGVDLTMLGRVAARVAFESRPIAPGIGGRRS